MDPVETHYLLIKRGTKFEYTLDVTGVVDLTGWTGKVQVRSRKRRDAELLAEWVNGTEITILGPEKQIQIDVAAAKTTDYSWGCGYFDLILYNPSSVPYAALQGRVSVINNVTV